MPDYLVPSNAALQEIAQELIPRLVAARPVFDEFPIVNEDAFLVMWEQKDNYAGLQQVRGLNGDPTRVKAIGGKRFMMPAGVYGEFLRIDEQQITERRQWGQPLAPIDLSDLVREAQDALLLRRLDRLEQIIWTLCATGTFSVADGSAVLHTDAYTTQTFTAGTTWATSATATPLADMRAVQLKSRGYSVDFGQRARAYMNRTTFNQLISNTNATDLGGRRGAGLSSINGPQQLNELFAMDDLPNIVIYDQGYYDDTRTFQLFIPNSKVIVIGARPAGDPVGNYKMVRNANNPGAAPGPYMKVDEHQGAVPITIDVHDGHNGGIALYHPAAIVAMSV